MAITKFVNADITCGIAENAMSFTAVLLASKEMILVDILENDWLAADNNVDDVIGVDREQSISLGRLASWWVFITASEAYLGGLNNSLLNEVAAR